MIFIIRALSHVRKECADYKKERSKKPKKRGQRSRNKKMREKERRDNATISFSTLVLQNSTMIFMIESLLCCHFHILVGIFHYRTWLVYSNDGLPQTPQDFMSKQVGCTPTQFLLLSFHIFIALVHPLHGNPYSLTLISINGHLHSPLIRLVNVRVSPSFLSSPQPPSIPPIVLCPWLTLMYCVEIEKV